MNRRPPQVKEENDVLREELGRLRIDHHRAQVGRGRPRRGAQPQCNRTSLPLPASSLPWERILRSSTVGALSALLLAGPPLDNVAAAGAVRARGCRAAEAAWCHWPGRQH